MTFRVKYLTENLKSSAVTAGETGAQCNFPICVYRIHINETRLKQKNINKNARRYISRTVYY